MNASKLKPPTFRMFITLLLVFTTFYFANPITVLAEHGAYTIVGSSGAVDEQSLAVYEFRNQFATIKSSVTSGTATYRYNLPPAGAANWLADDDSCPCFEQIRIRYRDLGTGDRIVVKLREYNLITDGVTTLYTFDSDAATDSEGTVTPANDPGNQSFDSVGQSFNFDFTEKGYFFEVDVIKNDATGNGGLIGLAIGDSLA